MLLDICGQRGNDQLAPSFKALRLPDLDFARQHIHVVQSCHECQNSVVSAPVEIH